ncbi:hypothetical protein [Roseibium aggregatum]|uniref:Leucine-binding protein domain-containing protein n=1 Tax=Roseibium aggregatum TaxID=187304 RepID=A0A939EAS3_9HYPH|nr:hypothetical protein [Roseibium aggregatum]MBN9669034.1 hypothetical protein [Roseibium aggregatum]
MRLLPFKPLTLFLAALLALPTSASADVIVLDNQALPPELRLSGQCGVEISGPIDGDTVARFKDTFRDLAAQPDAAFEAAGEWGLNVCLAGEGGDNAAAVDLANFFADRKIGTVVGPGQTCTGPCALAFMGGTIDYPTGVGPLRAMSPSSVLGFSLDAGETEQSSATAYRALYEILTAGSISRDRNGAVHSVHRRFPIEVTLELLRNTGGPGFFIDTLHKAALLDIALIGVPGASLNAQGLATLCETAYLLNSEMPLAGPVGRLLEGIGQEISPVEPVLGQNAFGATTFNFSWGAMHPIDCSVLPLDPGTYLVSTGDISSDDARSRVLKAYNGLPLSTGLAEVGALMDTITQ